MSLNGGDQNAYDLFKQSGPVKAARLICAIVREKALAKNVEFDSLDINIDSTGQYVEVQAFIEEDEYVIYQINHDDPYEYSVWISLVADIICNRLAEQKDGFYELDDYDRIYQIKPDGGYTLLLEKDYKDVESKGVTGQIYNPKTLRDMASILPHASLHYQYRGSELPRNWDCEKHSILWILGYQVGKNSPFPSNIQRHEFLNLFIRCNLPKIFPDSYLALWGAASAATRVQKLKNHISGLIYGRSWNEERYQCAIAHWQNDLEFLDRYF